MKEKMIERLFIYYTMRDDYERSLKLSYKRKQKINTEEGFCLYTHATFNLYFTRRGFPELFNFRPYYYSAYWFPQGEIRPRLNIINKAIALLEEKLNHSA